MSPVGRPEIGQPINVRLGDELLAAIDARARANGVSRASWIRSELRKRILADLDFSLDLLLDDR